MHLLSRKLHDRGGADPATYDQCMYFHSVFLRIAMVQIGVNRSMEEVAGKTAICGEQDAVGLSGLVLACNARMKMIGTPTSYIRGGILGMLL